VRLTGNFGRAGRTWLIGLGALALLAGAVTVGPLVYQVDPNVIVGSALERPRWGRPLGTDHLGRDVLARLLWGGRVTMGVGLGGTSLGAMLGMAVGIGAGTVRRIERVAMGVADVLLAFPRLLVALILVGILGVSAWNGVVAVAAGAIPWFARSVRNLTRREMEAGYVEAALAIGADLQWVVRRHVLPAVMPQAGAIVATAVAVGMYTASSLGFLGLLVKPPTPEWGGLVASARVYLMEAWWLLAAPAAALTLCILAASLAAGWRQ
jgi:peptide/nickel transport system permease protein